MIEKIHHIGVAVHSLDEAARSDANLMPVFIECAENYVTLGEICDVTREFFGEQREVVVI
jgi:methylmalonyl-CoA mutase N-terminal domain/subunit